MALYQFDQFTFDAAQRLLYAKGELVPMTPKTMDLLKVLLESAGEVVSKEQISAAVWEDVFIDESNIAKNISILRKTLRSSVDGEDPIRTVSKRGYQFVLAVRTVSSAPEEAAAATALPTPQTSSTAPQAGLATNGTASSGGRRPRRLLLWAAVPVVLALALLWLTLRRPHTMENGRAVVAVLPFGNLSGNADVAWVSTALRETLLSDLDAGGSLRTIPDDSVEQMTRDLGFRPAASLSRSTLDGIRSNLGCSYIVSGTYLKVGDSLRVDAYLQNTKTGEIVSRTSQTHPESELIGTITEVGDQLRSALHEAPLAGEQRQQVSANLPADAANLKLYAEGLQRLRVLDTAGALSFFTRLVAIDPSYPGVHSALSETYDLMGVDQQAASEAKLALNYSSGLSGEGRLLAEANYDRAVRHWPEAIVAQQALWRMRPENDDYGVRLAQIQVLAGKPQDALATVAQLEGSFGKEDPRVYIAEASIRYQNGEFPAMLTAAQQAQKLAKGQGAQTLFGRARTQEGDALIHIGRADQALAAFREAHSVAERYGDKVGLMHALRREGGAVGLDDPRASLPLFEQDCQTAKQIGDAREFLNCRIATAFIFQRLGDIGKAYPIFNESLAASEAAHDRRLEMVCLEAVGSADLRMARWAEAKEMQARASALAETMHSSSTKVTLLNDEGVLLQLHGDLPAARSVFEAALEAARKGTDSVSVANTLAHLAEVLDLTRDFAGAGKAIQEECTIWSDRHQKLGLSKCQVAAAVHTLASGDEAQAQALLDHASYDKTSIDPGFAAARVRTLLSLTRHDSAAATQAAKEADLLAASDATDIPLSLQNAMLQAQLQADTGDRRAALQQLEKAAARAHAAGLPGLQMEAQALHTRLLQTGKPSVGGARATVSAASA